MTKMKLARRRKVNLAALRFYKQTWLAGCKHANALFRFLCWILSGTDMVLEIRVRQKKKHKSLRAEMENTVKLASSVRKSQYCSLRPGVSNCLFCFTDHI